MTSDANPHLGTALDDLLAEDGPLGSVGATSVSQRGGPLELVTDGNACALGVYATEWGGRGLLGGASERLARARTTLAGPLPGVLRGGMAHWTAGREPRSQRRGVRLTAASRGSRLWQFLASH